MIERVKVETDPKLNFESKLILEMCNFYGCLKSHTTSYHPQVKEDVNDRLYGCLD